MTKKTNLKIRWEIDSNHSDFDVKFIGNSAGRYYWCCKSNSMNWDRMFKFIYNFNCKTFTLTIKKGDIVIKVVEIIDTHIILTHFNKIKNNINWETI